MLSIPTKLLVAANMSEDELATFANRMMGTLVTNSLRDLDDFVLAPMICSQSPMGFVVHAVAEESLWSSGPKPHASVALCPCPTAKDSWCRRRFLPFAMLSQLHASFDMHVG